MRILIGGLLPRQEQLMKANCPKGVELSFLDSDASPARWIRAARQCDYTVVMTKFISHKHTAALRDAGIGFIMCPGGTTLLKDMIEEIVHEGLGTEARRQIHRA